MIPERGAIHNIHDIKWLPCTINYIMVENTQNKKTNFMFHKEPRVPKQ